MDVELESELPSACRRKLILEFKGTHDKNGQPSSCAPGVGEFKSFMSDNSDSYDPAKFEAFKRIQAEIPYSLVLQELGRKGNTECRYR